MYGDLAILWCGPNQKQGRNFLLAVNKTTGETVWEHDEKVGSWGTPLIAKIDGRDQLLLSIVPHRPIGSTQFLATPSQLWSGQAGGTFGRPSRNRD